MDFEPHCGIIGHDIVDLATKCKELPKSIPLFEPGDFKKFEWSLTTEELRNIKENVTD